MNVVGHQCRPLPLGCAASTREPRRPATALAAADIVARRVHGGCCRPCICLRCRFLASLLRPPKLHATACAMLCGASKRLAFELLARGGELCRPPWLHDSHMTRRPDGARDCCMLAQRPGLAILLHVAACATPPNTQTLQPLSLGAASRCALRRLILLYWSHSSFFWCLR